MQSFPYIMVYPSHREIFLITDVEKKGITRNNVDPKVLREGRDLIIPLLQKKKPW
jgi:hypothetical protein